MSGHWGTCIYILVHPCVCVCVCMCDEHTSAWTDHMGLGGGFSWAELTGHKYGLVLRSGSLQCSSFQPLHKHTDTHTAGSSRGPGRWHPLPTCQKKACKLKVIPSRFEAMPARGGAAALAHLLLSLETSGSILCNEHNTERSNCHLFGLFWGGRAERLPEPREGCFHCSKRSH